MVTTIAMQPRPAFIAAAGIPPLPALARLALLLDLDGTLLDLAPAPAEVQVPPELPDLLGRLDFRLGGALALVSGRTIEAITALLPGLGVAVAGEHGAALRCRSWLPIERAPLPELPGRWREAARGLAAAYPGLFLEEKPHGLVLHFRCAEGAGPALGTALEGLLAASGEPFVLVPAAMAWEIRPRGVDKGTAVHALLARRPFAGRLPVFVGDDVTDEDGMRAARDLGGFGLRVAPTFGDAAGVRGWLGRLAAADESRKERP